MIYRCSECGLEYSKKPDFCDCGNDIFDEIESNLQQPLPKLSENKKTFKEQYPEISSFIKTLDPISVTIFSFCIILSICSFIFIKPSEKNTQDESVVKSEKVVKKVADINTFWDDTPPKVEIEQPQNEDNSDIVSQLKVVFNIQEQPQIQPAQNNKPKPVNNTVPNSKPKPKVTPIVKQPVVQPKTTKPTVSIQKGQSVKTTPKPQNTQVNSPKPAVKQNPQPTQTQQTSQNPPQQSQGNKTSPSTNTPAQTQTSQTQQYTIFQPEINTQTPQNSVNTALLNAQELKNYKNGLRKTLAGRIDFTKIYGNGTCSVDFKINSQGKLVDRKFSVTSTNNTLNDAVYKAVQLTPSYSVPPNAYNGEVLRLTVKYVNGNYSVALN